MYEEANIYLDCSKYDATRLLKLELRSRNKTAITAGKSASKPPSTSKSERDAMAKLNNRLVRTGGLCGVSVAVASTSPKDKIPMSRAAAEKSGHAKGQTRRRATFTDVAPSCWA